MSNKTVLIVEDEKSARQALKSKIKEYGYNILEAKDGQEGLNLAFDKHPDLIILDLIMPVKSGQQLLTELRRDEWGKNVAVIILTNSASTENVFDSLQHSAQDYFVKTDITLSDLIDDIKLRIGDAKNEQ